jgi:soluble lytic murein transglycosylase-like protein
MKSAAILLMFAWSAVAGEYAVLMSGARLHAERHETGGGKVTLYSQTGSTEMDAGAVVRFEPEDYIAPQVAGQSAAPAQSAADPVDMKELIDNAARKYGLPPELVRAVVAVESAYRPDAVSTKGAIGLMQLMPSTARGLGADPKVAEQNVDAGTRYLRDLLVKYDRRMFHALAAYNAGPGAVDKYHGVPPYRETHAYILKVLAQLAKATGEQLN